MLNDNLNAWTSKMCSGNYCQYIRKKDRSNVVVKFIILTEGGSKKVESEYVEKNALWGRELGR